MYIRPVAWVTGLNRLLTLHEQIFGNDKDDLTGALACATSYHVYHSLKFGNLPIIHNAIETGKFGLVRAFALSSARAFMNEFGILSKGLTLCIGCSSGLKREHNLMPLTSNSRPIAFNSHSDDDGPDILAQGSDL